MNIVFKATTSGEGFSSLLKIATYQPMLVDAVRYRLADVMLFANFLDKRLTQARFAYLCSWGSKFGTKNEGVE